MKKKGISLVLEEMAELPKGIKPQAEHSFAKELIDAWGNLGEMIPPLIDPTLSRAGRRQIETSRRREVLTWSKGGSHEKERESICKNRKW